jgi:hypothetical protein
MCFGVIHHVYWHIIENCTPLGHYAASSGNYFLTIGTNGLSRNVSKELPLLAANTSEEHSSPVLCGGSLKLSVASIC